MSARPRIVFSLFALLFLPFASVTASIESQRQLFLDAEAALGRGDRSQFTRHLRMLEAYPLRAYLVYADLSGRLDQRPVAEVRDFLQDEDGTLLADRLRGAWLARLAEDGNWPLYLEFHRPDGNPASECLRRQALLATSGRSVALDGFEDVWLHGRSLPASCDPLIKVWGARLGPDLVWERLRLAIEAGELRLAGYLARQLPAGEKVWAERWIELHNHPQRLATVDWGAGRHPKAGAILHHAWLRHVRSDPQAAALLWDERREKLGLDARLADAIEREIAMRMALRRLPATAARMAALPDHVFDDALRQWQLRDALGRGDWAQALTAVRAMSPEARADTTWRYWEARALEAGGLHAAAREIYAAVAGERSFYGFLAADRIGRPYRIAHRETEATAAEIAAVAGWPGIARASELFTLGRITDARREWTHGLAGLDNRGREVAALIADRVGWHDRAIISAAQARRFDDIDLRFPLDHRLLVDREAGRHGIDSAWAFAVIRQESAFMADVRSSAGALGLMQVMPATARTIAPKAGVKLRNTNALLDPAQNIRLGTWYLRDNLDHFGGHVALATAAYNAGRNRVRGWLPEGRTDADVWIETIPFGETREYVKRVLSYRVFYELRLGQPVTSLHRHLAPVAAAGELERLHEAHLRSPGAEPTRVASVCDAPGYSEAPCP